MQSLNDNNISSNTMSEYGGGISAVTFFVGSSITIKNNIISNNTTNGDGGGIYSNSTSYTLLTISDNAIEKYSTIYSTSYSYICW